MITSKESKSKSNLILQGARFVGKERQKEFRFDEFSALLNASMIFVAPGAYPSVFGATMGDCPYDFIPQFSNAEFSYPITRGTSPH
jgi:hypothetical protein